MESPSRPGREINQGKTEKRPSFLQRLRNQARGVLLFAAFSGASSATPAMAQAVDPMPSGLLSHPLLPENHAVVELDFPGSPRTLELCPSESTVVFRESMAYLFELDPEYKEMLAYVQKLGKRLKARTAWEKEPDWIPVEPSKETVEKFRREYERKFGPVKETTITAYHPPKQTAAQANQEAIEKSLQWSSEEMKKLLGIQEKEGEHDPLALSPDVTREVIYHAVLAAHLEYKAELIAAHSVKKEKGTPIQDLQKKTISFTLPQATIAGEENELAAHFYRRIAEAVKPKGARDILTYMGAAAGAAVTGQEWKVLVTAGTLVYDILASRKRAFWDKAYNEELAFLHKTNFKDLVQQDLASLASKTVSGAVEDSAIEAGTKAFLEQYLGAASNAFFASLRNNLLLGFIKEGGYELEYPVHALALRPEIHEARKKLLTQLPVIPYRCICDGYVESPSGSLDPDFVKTKFETRLAVLRQMEKLGIDIIEANPDEYPFTTHNFFDLPPKLCTGGKVKERRYVCSPGEDDCDKTKKMWEVENKTFDTASEHFVKKFKNSPLQNTCGIDYPLPAYVALIETFRGNRKKALQHIQRLEAIEKKWCHNVLSGALNTRALLALAYHQMGETQKAQEHGKKLHELYIKADAEEWGKWKADLSPNRIIAASHSRDMWMKVQDPADRALFSIGMAIQSGAIRQKGVDMINVLYERRNDKNNWSKSEYLLINDPLYRASFYYRVASFYSRLAVGFKLIGEEEKAREMYQNALMLLSYPFVPRQKDPSGLHKDAGPHFNADFLMAHYFVGQHLWSPPITNAPRQEMPPPPRSRFGCEASM